MARLFDVRGSEGRVALLGFATLLLLVITGHTILEAARDALLLTGPGPRALGVVYMTIAVCAWPAAALAARASERWGARRALAGILAVASALPVALFFAPPTHLVSMAVYVVSGLIGSIVVPQFWTLAGKVLTVAQGRRLFGLIAAAGVVGGVLGSGAAAGALLVVPVRWLLVLSATVLALALTALARVGAGERVDHPAPPEPARLRETVGALRKEPLLQWIALAVVVSTATLLVLDYRFKAALASALPKAEIGPFVARYYLALNGISLAVQVLLGSAVVRRFGVTRAILVTPLLLVLGAAGALLGGAALAPVLAMKAVDGSLRFSIHRITGELVYLPLPVLLRQRLKPLVDGALARASQTITGAALVALGGTWLAAPRPLAGVVMLLALAWLGIAVTMRRPYLARLREAISSGALRAQESPEPLDLESAQLLVQRLASQEPLEVVGAMNALSRRGHLGFVPALVLLHGDEGLLLQALEHFGDSDRADWVPLARRLLGDPREAVRMAAARALAMHGALDLEQIAHDVGWRVRGYAAVDLALKAGAEDVLDHELVSTLVRQGGEHGDFARLGMLAAVGDASPNRSLARLLAALSDRPGAPPEQTGLLARAAARQQAPRLVPCLVERLSAREGREAVRAALVAFGEEALGAVWWALRDTNRPRILRIHLPKTIARFGTRAAAEHLLENIETEEDGLVRYKSIRALEAMQAHGGIPLDRSRVERLALASLTRHFRLLAARVALGEPSAPPSTAERLLRGLLDDKLKQSLERVFRLLAVAHPREDFRHVRMACLSDDPYTRANAGEFLDALLHRNDEQTLRGLLRLVTDDLPAAERVARAAVVLARPVPHGRSEAVAALARDHDATVAALAALCPASAPANDGDPTADAGEPAHA